jgi:predicted MFS family arabinose efflux permease
MSWSFRGRLGALAEHDFRLLFTATTITTAGDQVAGIALAFAVLDIGSATDLGIVFAARQSVEVVVLVFGGVISDRLPRHLVLVAASLTQGLAQAVTAGAVLTGSASVTTIVLLQGLYGVGNGLVVPAEVGLVPQTVSPERLQQANALQGLTRNVLRVLGPAVGGALVVAGSPGVALGVDAASFVACAAVLQRIRIAARDVGAAAAGFFRELREGWSEFTSRTWLWTSVLLFGLGNLAFAAQGVLGPAVAKAELGGAGAWATIVTAGGVGSVVGGVVALRIRPSRPLAASVIAAAPFGLTLAALAVPAPLWLLAATSFVAGGGLSVHLALWFTVFQQRVPERAQSRVSSYDALGSFVLMPIGFALAGPLADSIGISATLWAAFALDLGCLATILLIPSVWAIRRIVPAATEAAFPS